jgi:hypothetical protein
MYLFHLKINVEITAIIWDMFCDRIYHIAVKLRPLPSFSMFYFDKKMATLRCSHRTFSAVLREDPCVLIVFQRASATEGDEHGDAI